MVLTRACRGQHLKGKQSEILKENNEGNSYVVRLLIFNKIEIAISYRRKLQL
jgi:hypothetical protein